MLSCKSEFKFWDRGFKDTLVLIPGWATDYRIFDCLNLNYNYLLAVRLYPFNFNHALLDYLDELKLSNTSVFGFSLGGFLACEFATKYPGKIKELILIGMRKKYEPKTLEEIKACLWKNKEAWLYKFYVSCFSGADLDGLNWFKKYLLKEYIRNIDLKELIWGLDYLSSHQVQAKALADIENIKIFQGSDDTLVPLEEALQIKSELPQAKFIYLPGSGHISFLNPIFRERFYYG